MNFYIILFKMSICLALSIFKIILGMIIIERPYLKEDLMENTKMIV